MKKLLLVLSLVVLTGTTAFAWPTWTGVATITAATDNNTSSGISVPRDCKNNFGVTYSGITSATVAVHVSNDGVTYAAYSYNAGAAAAPAAYVIGAGTGGVYELPRGVSAFKYMRFETGAEQAADETFTVTCN